MAIILRLSCLLMIMVAAPALAMDCQQHLRIGYKLHTSSHSSTVAEDRELLQQIRMHYHTALQKCPALCADEPGLCNNLGDVYYRLGDVDLAVEFFHKALHHRPGFVDPLYELGRIHEQRGLLGSALDYALKAHTTSPHDEQVEQLARKLTNQMCKLSRDGTYRKDADPGEHLSKAQLHDVLVATAAFNQARERFGLCRRNIFVAAVALRNILFASGKAQLQADNDGQLQALIDLLQDNVDMTLVIEGHTDNQPVRRNIEVRTGISCADNRCLSMERARAVKDFLVAGRIEPGRLRIEGLGDSQPLDRDQPAKNRRVQLRSGKLSLLPINGTPGYFFAHKQRHETRYHRRCSGRLIPIDTRALLIR